MNLLNKEIKKLPGYPFDRLRSLLANTNAANSEVIDMSIGQPMHKVPNFIKDIIKNPKFYARSAYGIKDLLIQ